MRVLSELVPGRPAVVDDIRCLPELTRRLAALGLRVGRQVVLVRRAWLGGPVQVRVGATEFMLRRAEAAAISVWLPEDRP
ncbi:ferrous iron transport protein A [Chitiniphilus purpureus]|uniref:Ferrous iron transport protein A n=1 Tax=Chitiniphilus purpureus TaxID=2981137 RepID=A0ABY6DL76_9NEIS|nr:FeoA family protein [Chitiniphilus sp. CD1]UXY15105.1 ferrous iron transport protein A [Chitiniphilus sp. CD1]